MVNNDEAQTFFLGLIFLGLVVAILLMKNWFEYQRGKDAKKFAQQEEVMQAAMKKINEVTEDVSMIKKLLNPFNNN